MTTTDVDHLTGTAVGSRADRRLLGRMLVFARPHAGALVVTMLLLMVGLGLRLAGPWIMKQVIDGPIARAAATRDSPDFDVSGLTEEVTRWGLMFLGVVAAMSALLVLREWLMNRTGQQIVLSIRNTLFHHVLRLPVSWFDRHHVGWTVTRTTSDVDALSELFTTGVATIAYDVLTIFVVVGVLLWISPALSVAALLILPVMIWVSFRFRLKARMAYRATRHSLSRLNGFLQERLTGLDVVRLFRREQSSSHRFDELNDRYYTDNMVTVKHFSLFFPTVDTLSLGVKMGTLVWGSWLLMNGRITLGTFIMFWFLLDFVFEPIRELAERYNVLQAAMAAGERIFGILDAPEETGTVAVSDMVRAATQEPSAAQGTRAPTVTKPERSPGTAVAGEGAEPPAIAFEGVSFAYDTGPDVLTDVSFEIGRGQRVAVVGHTGAGKTTLVSLLCRFHATDRGTIRLHGRDVRSLDLEDLRRRIAIVQQDVFLFSETIGSNIRLGSDAITPERLAQVGHAVNADRFVDRLANGYDTPLLERGSNLSSGQRQLIAFARALAADPEILVLDEATSSVDSETEHWIEEATAHLLEGRTSLVIAHRLSTVISADRILVMHKGRLREQGTHEELLAQRGLYHRLYHLHLSGGSL